MSAPDQFDPTLLPEEARALNPDQEGNLNYSGQLKASLGPRSFEVENGHLTIVDRGTRRAPNPHEMGEVVQAIRSNVRGNEVRIKVVEEGGQSTIRVVLNEGGKEVSVAEAHVNAFHAKLKAQAAAIEEQRRADEDAARLAAEAAAAKEKKEREFMEEWTEKKRKIEEAMETQGSLAKIHTTAQVSSLIKNTRRQYNEDDHRDDLNYVDRLHQELLLVQHVLEQVFEYASSLEAAAKQESISLEKAPFSALSLPNLNTLKVLFNQLGDLEDEVKTRLDELTNQDNFVAKIQAKYSQELGTNPNPAIAGIMTQLTLTDGVEQFAQNPRYNISPAVDVEDEADLEEELQEQKELMEAIQKIRNIGEFFKKELAKVQAAIDLDDPSMASLKRFDVDEEKLGRIEAIVQQRMTLLTKRLAINASYANTRQAAYGALRAEDQKRIDDIEASVDILEAEAADQRVDELSNEINPNASTEDLQAHRQELNDTQIPVLDRYRQLTTRMRDFYNNVSGQITDDTLKGAELRTSCQSLSTLHEGMRARAHLQIQKAEAAIAHATDLLQKRDVAITRLKKHKAAILPTRMERLGKKFTQARAFVTGIGAESIEAERTARRAAEAGDTVLSGDCYIKGDGVEDLMRFTPEGVFKITEDPDGKEVEARVDDEGELNDIAAALNQGRVEPRREVDWVNFGKPGDHIEFVVNPDEGTVIRRSTGEAKAFSDVYKGLRRAGKNTLDRLSQQRKEKKEKEAILKAHKELIKENNLVAVVTELQGEGKDEAAILEELKMMIEEEYEGEMEDIYKEIIDQQKEKADKARPWKERWPITAKLGSWLGKAGSGLAKGAEWAWKHTNFKTIGKVAAGAGAVAGAVALGTIYVGTKTVQKTWQLGGNVLKIGAPIGAAVLGTGARTVGRTIAAPFRIAVSPFDGLGSGYEAGYNYIQPPHYTEAKGFTKPFTWAANAMRWGWHKTKAIPTAVAGATVGAGLGLGRGIINNLAGIAGIKARIPDFWFIRSEKPAKKPSAKPAAANHAGEHPEHHAHAA